MQPTSKINNAKEKAIKAAHAVNCSIGTYFRKAITVKYLPCTNTKPSRYKATFGRYSITRSTDACDPLTLAMELAYRMEIPGTWRGGQIENADYVFVCDYNCPTFKVSRYNFDNPENY